MTASPLCYDGKYIYAISSERNKNDPKTVLKYALEVFELKSAANVCSFVKRLHIRNDGAESIYLPNWLLHNKTYKTEGGVLDHCSLVCNGDVLIWHWPYKTAYFNAQTGVRIHTRVNLDQAQKPH